MNQIAFYLHQDETEGFFVVQQPQGKSARIISGPITSSAAAKKNMEQKVLKSFPQAQWGTRPVWADGQVSDEGYPLTPAYDAAWVTQ